MSLKRSRNAIDADDQQGQSTFVFYGTALPPQNHEVRDDGSYVPLWKQEVTDERGRKRLHGAFTGGFSAGYVALEVPGHGHKQLTILLSRYFNTVGSKEGLLFIACPYSPPPPPLNRSHIYTFIRTNRMDTRLFQILSYRSCKRHTSSSRRLHGRRRSYRGRRG